MTYAANTITAYHFHLEFQCRQTESDWINIQTILDKQVVMTKIHTKNALIQTTFLAAVVINVRKLKIDQC